MTTQTNIQTISSKQMCSFFNNGNPMDTNTTYTNKKGTQFTLDWIDNNSLGLFRLTKNDGNNNVNKELFRLVYDNKSHLNPS